jgi:hypothetical protein
MRSVSRNISLPICNWTDSRPKTIVLRRSGTSIAPVPDSESLGLAIASLRSFDSEPSSRDALPLPVLSTRNSPL